MTQLIETVHCRGYLAMAMTYLQQMEGRRWAGNKTSSTLGLYYVQNKEQRRVDEY